MDPGRLRRRPRGTRRFDHGLRRLRAPAAAAFAPAPAPDLLRARLDAAQAAIEARGWLVQRGDQP